VQEQSLDELIIITTLNNDYSPAQDKYKDNQVAGFAGPVFSDVDLQLAVVEGDKGRQTNAHLDPLPQPDFSLAPPPRRCALEKNADPAIRRLPSHVPILKICTSLQTR